MNTTSSVSETFDTLTIYLSITPGLLNPPGCHVKRFCLPCSWKIFSSDLGIDSFLITRNKYTCSQHLYHLDPPANWAFFRKQRRSTTRLKKPSKQTHQKPQRTVTSIPRGLIATAVYRITTPAWDIVGIKLWPVGNLSKHDLWTVSILLSMDIIIIRCNWFPFDFWKQIHQENSINPLLIYSS